MGHARLHRRAPGPDTIALRRQHQPALLVEAGDGTRRRPRRGHRHPPPRARPGRRAARRLDVLLDAPAHGPHPGPRLLRATLPGRLRHPHLRLDVGAGARGECRPALPRLPVHRRRIPGAGGLGAQPHQRCRCPRHRGRSAEAGRTSTTIRRTTMSFWTRCWRRLRLPPTETCPSWPGGRAIPSGYDLRRPRVPEGALDGGCEGWSSCAP